MSRLNKKIQKNCLVCNKIFFTSLSRIKNGKDKFCSNKCRIIERNKKIQKNCLVCNKIFFTRLSRIKNGYGKFCSRICSVINQTEIKSSPEHFWEQINIKENINECWEWKNGTYCNRYGYVHYNKKMQRSHRIAYFLSYPEKDTEENQKLLVCHTCDNPPCCNPYHLFLGTHQENMDDMIQKGRNNTPKGKNHYNAKLDEFDVKQILLLKDILKIQTIKEMYKVNYATIYDIFNNITWKHVSRV